MRIGVERAASNLQLARKDIWPDLTVGVQYGLGRMEGGARSMGGASVGFSVPVFAGKRQRKAAEEAMALESVAKSRFEGLLALVNADIASVVADLDRSRTLLRLYQEEILPQARAGVASSLSAYRVGSVDFSTLVDAQLAVNRFDNEYFGLLAAYGASLAKLETTIGHDLPVTGPLISEER
jgi:outer membrane protein TolC